MMGQLREADELRRIGAAFRSRRLARELTRAAVSARAGVSEATIKVFERTGQASLRSVVRLLHAVEAADLLGLLQQPTASTRTYGRRRDTVAPAAPRSRSVPGASLAGPIRFSAAAWQRVLASPAGRAAQAYGEDLSAMRMNLERSPTERVRHLAERAAFLAALRRAPRRRGLKAT